MIKVLFICHGNICRSPMAEFVMKDLVKKAGLADQFEIASAATSREEIGNPVHRGTRNKLKQYGISVDGKYAVQMTSADYRYYDTSLPWNDTIYAIWNDLSMVIRITKYIFYWILQIARVILQIRGIQEILMKHMMMF